MGTRSWCGKVDECDKKEGVLLKLTFLLTQSSSNIKRTVHTESADRKRDHAKNNRKKNRIESIDTAIPPRFEDGKKEKKRKEKVGEGMKVVSNYKTCRSMDCIFKFVFLFQSVFSKKILLSLYIKKNTIFKSQRFSNFESQLILYII